MSEQTRNLDSLKDIHDIRRIMERSSRFISLSGLSGVSAGICALAASWFAYGWITEFNRHPTYEGYRKLEFNLLVMSGTVLGVALVVAYFFTSRKARRDQQSVWNMTSRKMMWNMLVPLVCGGLFILAMVQHDEWRFLVPACLIFYGLALVSGSKYTLSDIRYLGYLEIALGLASTQFIGYGLYFWATGFGVLHIVYGIIMWWKYERKQGPLV